MHYEEEYLEEEEESDYKWLDDDWQCKGTHRKTTKKNKKG